MSEGSDLQSQNQLHEGVRSALMTKRRKLALMSFVANDMATYCVMNSKWERCTNRWRRSRMSARCSRTGKLEQVLVSELRTEVM